MPQLAVRDVVSGLADATVAAPVGSARHAWSLGAYEQRIVQALVRDRRCETAFEIGTFNGGTTRVLAEALPEDGVVWTFDLPPRRFDQEQAPDAFSGALIGEAYRRSVAASKVRQLFGDSLTFDFGPYAQCADFVLIDAGHEYDNGIADTNAALTLVRDGGVIVWDDFEAYWYGLIHGICDAMGERPLYRLNGTALAIHFASSA